MFQTMLRYLSFAFWSHCAAAAVLSAPTASITPAPILDKRAATTVGYYSTGTSDGTVLWGTVTVETEGGLVATSGSLFAVCQSNPCYIGTCSAGSFTIGTTTTACNPSANSLTCSYNLLYNDISDTAPLTNFFCDATTETGFVMVKTTPIGSLPSSTLAQSTSDSSDTESSSAISTASSVSSASNGNTTPTPSSSGSSTPISTGSKKSTPVGAIVGGVVGGLAVIGALIVGAIFLLRRNRKNKMAPANTYTAPTAAPPQQESKPYDYTGIAQAPPPQKFPDQATYPYAVEVGGAPAPPMSPVPQYTPNNGAVNELPAQRY